MNRIQALTLKFNQTPGEKVLARITELGGEYSDYDPVTDMLFVAWFDNLTEAELLELTETAEAEPKFGLEQRYKVETAEVDEEGNTIFEAVTKESFQRHKETLMSADKVSDIMTARSAAAEEKLSEFGGIRELDETLIKK